MALSGSWDSQYAGVPSCVESYAHISPSEIMDLAGSASMSRLPRDGMLDCPKTTDVAPANLNLTSAYAAYGQSYSGLQDMKFARTSFSPGSAVLSPGTTPSSLPSSSPHGHYSATPGSENQSLSPSFLNSASLYAPVSSSANSSPYTQASGSSTNSDAITRSFKQPYGYSVFGYNHVAGCPPSSSFDGVKSYVGDISQSPLMRSSTMGLYSNSYMTFPYQPSVGWAATMPGFSNVMAQDELDWYRYHQHSNPYFPALPPAGPRIQNLYPQSLQPGLIQTHSFKDNKVHSPAPKKLKKSTEEAERPPTPAPRDPASFHSHRGIYLFVSDAGPGSCDFFSDTYITLERDLCEKLSRISLPGKIQYVYNPLEYAFGPHLKFVRKFCTGEKYILFVGMNPGPFGMSQNGVPFGECAIVKEWLKIDGQVLKPLLEHPKRRVLGLECSRSDVTGGRFWQVFRTLCHTPEHFFRTCYVHNLCPFAFLTDSGKNVTPPQLTSSVLDEINSLCNSTLVEVVRLLKSKYVVCIGRCALTQAQKALSADEFSGITLDCLMHPSPINPAANKGWSDIAIKQLTQIGIIDIIRYGTVQYQATNQSASLSHPSCAPASQRLHPPQLDRQLPTHGFQSPPLHPYHCLAAQMTNPHQSPVPQLNQSPDQTSFKQESPDQTSSFKQESPDQPSSFKQESPDQTSSFKQESPAHTSYSQTQQELCDNSHNQNMGNSSKCVLHSEKEERPNDIHHFNREDSRSEENSCKNCLLLKPLRGFPNKSHQPWLTATAANPACSSDLGGLGCEHATEADTTSLISPHVSCLSRHAETEFSDSEHLAQSSHIFSVAADVQKRTLNHRIHDTLGSQHSFHVLNTGQQQGSGQHISPHMKTSDSHLVPPDSCTKPTWGSHTPTTPMETHGMRVLGHVDFMDAYGQIDMGQMDNCVPSMSLTRYSCMSGMSSSLNMSDYRHMSIHDTDQHIHNTDQHGHIGLFSHNTGAERASMNSVYDSHNTGAERASMNSVYDSHNTGAERASMNSVYDSHNTGAERASMNSVYDSHNTGAERASMNSVYDSHNTGAERASMNSVYDSQLEKDMGYTDY